MIKQIFNSKKGGLAEFYIFVGSLAILLIIFLGLFAIAKFKNSDQNENVNLKYLRINNELLLLNYLRTPFLDKINNYADYVVMSNFHLVKQDDLSTLPVNYDFFISSTKQYFGKTLDYSDKSWILTITPLTGRNVIDKYRESGEINIDEDVKPVYIYGNSAKRNRQSILSTQIIPSPDERAYLVQLYEAN